MDNQQNINEQQTPASSEVVKSENITLQSILDCRSNSSIAITKILEGQALNPDQLDLVDKYQKSCFQKFNIIKNKIAGEPSSKSSIALFNAITKTEQRIKIDQRMVNLLKSNNPGINLGEESLSFIYARKIVLPREDSAWVEYRQVLENESVVQEQGNTDYFGWGLLIIMAFILGRALLKRKLSDNEPLKDDKPQL